MEARSAFGAKRAAKAVQEAELAAAEVQRRRAAQRVAQRKHEEEVALLKGRVKQLESSESASANRVAELEGRNAELHASMREGSRKKQARWGPSAGQ